jgi:YHS domain-containing protein
MRYLIIFALLYLCYYVAKKAILPVIRTYKTLKKQRESFADKEMVQDPLCHTYVPKETALRTTIGGKVYYFCSQDCLDEYIKEARDRENGT